MARDAVRLYAEYYETKTLKQYLTGTRKTRQFILQASKELKITPTLEGGLDFKKNITEAIDGYPGHEHTWPAFPFQEDLYKFFGQSGIVYTPTVLVAYGGPWSENYWFQRGDVHGDATNLGAS